MKNVQGNSLVGILVALAIGVLLVLLLVGGSGMLGQKAPERADKVGQTLVGRSLARAKDAKCMEQLSQLRQAIEIATDPVEGTRPASLEETKLGADFYRCPIGKEPYNYDAQTGKASCPHKGHEKY